MVGRRTLEAQVRVHKTPEEVRHVRVAVRKWRVREELERPTAFAAQWIDLVVCCVKDAARVAERKLRKDRRRIGHERVQVQQQLRCDELERVIAVWKTSTRRLQLREPRNFLRSRRDHSDVCLLASERVFDT